MNNQNRPDRDLLYSFGFIVLAYLTLWLGLKTNPGHFLFLFGLPFLGLPFLFVIRAIYLAIRWGIKTPFDGGRRKFFGFIPNTAWGIVTPLIITIAVSNILLIFYIFLRIYIF